MNDLPEPEIIPALPAAFESQVSLAGASFDLTIPRHTFPLGLVALMVSLVLSCSCAMRAAERVVEQVFWCLGLEQKVPDWSTSRLWLLRIGLFKLQRRLPVANDWVWIVDHTNQLGVEKCLVVVGTRLSMLPERPLNFEDVETLAVVPTEKSNGELVAEQLEAIVARTGVPRLIVADEGPDILSGVGIFCEKHPGTVFIYDIKHKTAAELKRALKGTPRWDRFCSLAATCSRQVQQTELAPLRPPNQRSKARYMNLETLVDWGRRVLNVLDGRTKAGRAVLSELQTDKTRLNEKLGWVRTFESDLANWAELHRVASFAEETVRQGGYTRSSGDVFERSLRGIATTPSAKGLRRSMIEFVADQAAKAHPGERLLGSSEVLESIFGGFKKFEGDQRRSGLTGSLLVIPALTGFLDEVMVSDALATVKTADLQDWIRENVGMTVQSHRRRLLSELQKAPSSSGQQGTKTRSPAPSGSN